MKRLTNPAFLKNVKDAIKYYDMIESGDKVLVAVSGGADSVCLLNVMVELRKKLGIEVVVGNVDHGIRGEESEKDSEFVKKQSEELGLKYVGGKVKVITGKKEAMSVEERAREKRYAFLKKAAAKNGCGVIATGHTIDDQAETVLMRVVYGSSLSGLSGVAPVRHEDGIKVIRPLIRISKCDILHYLKVIKADFVEDSTNSDIRYLRNKVRLDLLPLLEKGYNPKVRRALANLSDVLREDMAYIEESKKAAIRSVSSGKKSRVRLKDLVLQPVLLRKEIFKELFALAGGNVKKLTYRHWMDVDGLIRYSEKGKILDLPGKVKVRRTGTELVFSKKT